MENNEKRICCSLRDNFMTAADAAEYGLIDKVITKR